MPVSPTPGRACGKDRTTAPRNPRPPACRGWRRGHQPESLKLRVPSCSFPVYARSFSVYSVTDSQSAPTRRRRFYGRDLVLFPLPSEREKVTVRVRSFASPRVLQPAMLLTRVALARHYYSLGVKSRSGGGSSGNFQTM